MTVSSLRSIYQQYKHDTDVVASWLASTAKSLGYNAPLGPPAPTEQKSQRLKGKARKNAKEGKTPQNGSDKQASKPKYTLAIKDFIPLSEHIAGVTDKTIEIPDYFNLALERANALNFSSIENATPRTDGDRARPRALQNLFEVLDVYEPSAEFLAAPDVVPPPKPTELEHTVEESTDSVVEAFMAMTMLMDDLSRLRAEIADLWARHKAGELDPATVSVATNTAIHLAHSMEDEVYPVIKTFVESVPFHELYFAGICQEAGYDALKPRRSFHTDDYNSDVYDIADALFINTRNAILVFLANFQPPLMSYNGKWGRFDENASQPPKTNREKYVRDKSTMQEVLQDLPLLFNRPGAIEDQFIHAFTAACTSYEKADTSKQPPIWACFAFQIYLDILYSTEVGAGWTQMRNEVETIQRYVEKYPGASSDMKKLIKSLGGITEADPIAAIRSTQGETYKEYTVWRRNPTQCGLWIHFARTIFHREGAKYAATPGAVMCATQLYHALREPQLLLEEWKDLQTLWDMQGNSTYFVGEPPKDFEGHWKNYLICIGASATNWASGKRNTKVKETKANVRQMKFKGPVSSWMASRTATDGDQRPITAEAIENAIEEAARHHSSLASVASTIRKQPHVIQKLAIALQAEAPEITSDYFTMHDLCWDLMERMKEQFRPIIAEKSGKQWEAQKSNLPFVVGFVFSTAAGKKDIETKGVPSEELLNIAVEVTKNLLDEGKGTVITEGHLEI
ncbi:hypothetical protein ACET3X_003380 [Alternaria dauci]|uniref:DUF6604 domain-containing protein n=1 Tax=Alternaria dauci TaxID=48095 RepID=A0ABR3USE1_9PLEO